MRFFVLFIVVSLLYVSSAFAYDLSIDSIPVPTALQNAVFVEVKDESTKIPNGQINFDNGIVGITNMQAGNIQAVVLGKFSVVFNDLPKSKETLDLNPFLNNSYIDNQCQSGFIALGQLPFVSLKNPRFKPFGWDNLKAEQQHQFIEVYLQSYSDTWLEASEHTGMSQMPTGMGGTLKLRAPKGKEAFLALFRNDKSRVDYRMDENGTDFTIRDYYKNLTIVQYPWFRQIQDNEMEVGLNNKEFTVIQANYDYKFDSDSRLLQTNIDLIIDTNKATNSIQLYGAPQYNLTSAILVLDKNTTSLKINRNLDKNPDDWSVELAGMIPAGKHRIVLSGEQVMPKDWSTVGYDGSYRFDLSPLWPFYGKPVYIKMNLNLTNSKDWYFASSSKCTKSEVKSNVASFIWKETSRNRMIVASSHKPVDITNNGITLKVYAPEAMQPELEKLDYVKAISNMLAYFQEQYGDRQIKEQPVFILPEEQGVQAFENAELIFILGSGQIGLPLIGHEIAHIWWGEGTSAPRWFQEGMANYSTTKFMESYSPVQGKEYRKYLMNFALSNLLPISIETRDQIDDVGAVYHNSAAIMFEFEYLFGTENWHSMLRQLYKRNTSKFFISKKELYSEFNTISKDATSDLFDLYCEKGQVKNIDDIDADYKQFALNPSRQKYIEMWPWLVSIKRKQSIGDNSGALYCALQAVKFRSDPKDLVNIAQLRLLIGQVEMAKNMAMELTANSAVDPRSQIKTICILADIAKIENDRESELKHLKRIVSEGMSLGLMQDVAKAQKRLAELQSS